MSSTSAADDVPHKSSAHKESVSSNSNPDLMESNHDLPARTMAMAEDERHEHGDAHKDDPATMAASEELKHTTISDNTATKSRVQEPAVEPAGEDKVMEETPKAGTPDLEPSEVQDEEMRERLSSPKKKRGRDQDEDEDTKNIGEDNVDEPGSSADASVINGSRTTRSEPEKKRPRDTSEELPKSAEKPKEAKAEIVDLKTTDQTPRSPSKESPTNATSDKPKTSASAFASSGFASLAASSNSPFGSLGATKPSIFSGTAQPAPSGFGALAAAKSPASTAPATSGFGGLASGDKSTTGFGFGSGTTSGFGGLATGSVFGSKLGNGFAGGAGPKLSSFAAPGKENAPIPAKPAKAFGAPESDEDADSDEDGSDGEAASDHEDAAATEEKKKVKSAKVHIDDGEAGEATLLQLRAKIFAMESKEIGWKERGVGTLKINVPVSSASFDDNGVAVPGSFDPSGLEDEDEENKVVGPRIPRLIMRQENTHRVILNTVILRGTAFTDKPGTSTAQIMFTAIEGDKEPKPVSMILKMSEANARLFHAEIDSIQREL